MIRWAHCPNSFPFGHPLRMNAIGGCDAGDVGYPHPIVSAPNAVASTFSSNPRGAIPKLHFRLFGKIFPLFAGSPDPPAVPSLPCVAPRVPCPADCRFPETPALLRLPAPYANGEPDPLQYLIFSSICCPLFSLSPNNQSVWILNYLLYFFLVSPYPFPSLM